MPLALIIKSNAADMLIFVFTCCNVAMDCINIVVGHAFVRVAVHQWLLLRVFECVDLMEIVNHLLPIITWILTIELHVLCDERLRDHFFVVCALRLVKRRVNGIRVKILFLHELTGALRVVFLRVDVRIHAL